MEKKETEEETALREIREETGLKVKLDTGFRQAVSYSPKPGVWKDVVYFAAKCEQSKTTPQEEEVLELRWESPAWPWAPSPTKTTESSSRPSWSTGRRNPRPDLSPRKPPPGPLLQ